jgi:uncharacterized protein (TIGR03435 family)
MMKIEEILARLVHVSRTNNGWQARCPAHDDVKPSLSIGIDDGKTLLYCHAGCKTEDIVQAMGLSMRDLFPNKTSERTVMAKYPYPDENGTLLFEVLRYEPKDFKVRQLIAVVLAVFVGVVAAQLKAQSPTVPQWQVDAGGKMAFDVASVKQNKSGSPPHADFSLDNGNSYAANGGLFSVTGFPVAAYIAFAYKLTPGQRQFLQPSLPKWAATERFDIRARAADSNPSKDQVRLMVQSLLADRFKLTVHFETRQLPVFALVLAKSGKLGPQLQPHSDDAPCSTLTPPPPTPGSARPSGLPPVCGVFWGDVIAGRMQFRARSVSMRYVADSLSALGRLDRPIVDQTGLSGTFDLTVDAPDVPPPPGKSIEPDPSAPTFLEDLQEQLGLKLQPQTGAVDVLAIDHVEEPSPN